MENIDKGKVNTHDQSDLLGLKPFGDIGPGRTTEETKVVSKLKKKKAAQLRAKGSTFKEGIEANAGKVSAAIGHFANK
jgi:hypothetical protein